MKSGIKERKKTEALEHLQSELSKRWIDRRLVFGNGNMNARLAIIGEAPGRQEEIYGKPFVGKSGRLLIDTLQKLGINRDDIWITNLMKWRPVRNDLRNSTRPPRLKEINSFLPYLRAELKIIKPSLILCLGMVSARTLISGDFNMGRDHGKISRLDDGTMVIATYHPSYVFRFGGSRHSSILHQWKADIRKAIRT